MNQQLLENYFQRCEDILKQVIKEIKKLYSKQQEIKRREENILKIKDNTAKILHILKTHKEKSMNQNIQSLTKIMDIKHKANIFSIIELNDLRIATGDSIGYISLFSIDYEKEQWTKLREHQGHNKCITSLCELNENRLVSSSWDKTLKVWNINNNSIILLKKLKGHGNYVNQVISFTNNIIASGSYDKTIKVWDVNANGELRSLEENFKVCSLLKLNNKEIMASSGYGNSISFWNTQTYTKEHSVTCCDCNSFSGIIELPDTHYIAVSGGCSSSIDIIDTENYQLVKQIECKDYIINNGYCSSLHLLNNGTFIYSHYGSLCQISSIPYEIQFKLKMKDEFRGTTMISSLNDKYIITDNDKEGISIFRINFF